MYKSALVELKPKESRQAWVFGRFAAFEERQGEYERACVIYRHATKFLNLGQEPNKSLSVGKYNCLSVIIVDINLEGRPLSQKLSLVY